MLIEGDIMNKKYCLYGLTVESEVEFKQLITSSDEIVADVFIRESKCCDEVTEYLRKNGSLETQYEIGLDYSCFMNIGGYYVIKDGREIIFETKEGYTPEKISSWLLGFAFAMLLLERRTLAVHCSAVCSDMENSDGGAILISGEPGAGKSSLTKKLMEDGYKIMADDVAAVRLEDEVTVYPAFPYQKLVRNEVEKRGLNKDELIYINEDKDKFLVPVGDAFCAEPRKIKFMVFIVVSDVPEVQVRKLAGIEQLMAFRTNLFLHRLCGKWENDQEVLNLCLKAAGKCPVYLVIRPKDVDSVAAMADIVKNAEA